MSKEVESKLIAAGVRNLQEYGYPECNAENIITDMIYREFFLGMLRGTDPTGSADIKSSIDKLIARCASAEETKK